MDVHPGDVAIGDVVSYADRSFRPLIEEKGLRFEVELAPDLPAQIETDEQRLQQILRNLLSNAVKFTESGAVTLSITPRPDERRRAGRRVRGARHRHRHPGRPPRDHLRGVPAGRRHHEPPLRRHRARPLDQQGDRAAARRRDRRRLAGRRGQRVHAPSADGVRARLAGRRAERAVAAAAAGGGRRRSARGRARDRGRPRHDRSGRPRAPDRRGRPGVRRDPARARPRSAGSRASSRCAATPGSRSRMPAGPPRSSSTSPCRCSTAGACSRG